MDATFYFDTCGKFFDDHEKKGNATQLYPETICLKYEVDTA